MPHDYRYDPFSDASEAINITGETHIIPSNSPYTIRLEEVPKKDNPSSISLTIAGVTANEVSAAPASGEFWPDYSTKADNDDSWNTGTILFNAADAGKTVIVSYTGTGTLVASGNPPNIDLITTSGSWLCPEGVTEITLDAIGGGYSGSSGGTGITNNAGAGGEAGKYLRNVKCSVVPGTSYTVVIGAAPGGNTVFGNLYSTADASDVLPHYLPADGADGISATAYKVTGRGGEGGKGYGAGGGGGAGQVYTQNTAARSCGGEGGHGGLIVNGVLSPVAGTGGTATSSAPGTGGAGNNGALVIRY